MIAFRLLCSMFRRLIRTGHLVVIDYDGARREFGGGERALVMQLHDKWTAFDLLTDPFLAFGEAYMDRRLTVENGDIGALVELMARNLGTGAGEGYLKYYAWVRRHLPSSGRGNSDERALKNVRHHYDLDGALYNLFLDTDKQYSCAFFERPDDTLETAQTNKKRRIAAKLALRPGMRVLDIGSGWGGLGLYLAAYERADVTGITLSHEQLKIANARAMSIGLGERARFRLEDYRHTMENFDRVVSVGMFEHVGPRHYDEFFSRLRFLMKSDGVALIHTIGRSDGPGRTNPWIEKYIFPGGYVPALSEVLPSIERAGLMVSDVEIWRLHYALTLAEWRRRFATNRERAARVFGERFCRMWELYLAGAESAFKHQGQAVFQLQLVKRVDALPIVRDYMIPAKVAGAAQAAGSTGANRTQP